MLATTQDDASSARGRPCPCPTGEERVAVIIPVYRDWPRLQRCLDALAQQSIAAGQFEIIVVDNDAEPTPAPLNFPPNARLIHEPRPGSYVARNAGIAATRAPVLAFTDSDCVPDRDWLSNGLAALAQHAGSRVTGPVPIFMEPGASRLAHLYELHTAFPQLSYVRNGHCVTANLIVERSAFDRVGPFDECFSGGDTRWGRRAQARDIPIVLVDGVRVRHPSRRSVSDILHKSRRTGGSLPRYSSLQAFVWRKIRPPVWLIRRLRREQLGVVDSLLLFAIHWAAQVTEVTEYGLVQLGAKAPPRA